MTTLSTTHTLVGGWRLAEPFGGGGLNGGGLAIDFPGRTLYAYVNNPSVGRVGVAVFDLPEHGTGNDTNQWPTLTARDFLPAWWDFDNPETSQGPFCQGLLFADGKLWAVTRDFYPVIPADTVVVKAVDGERKVYSLNRQAFGNFVKGPGGSYRLGCGGHETGQGTVNGPCLAELDGTVRITYASLPWDVGESLENWNRVAPRPPDYWPVGHVDTWLAWEPRDTDGDGVIEGRWAADHVDSGGLTLPDAIYYWALQGIGEKDYLHQHESASPVFADSWANHRTRVYRYHPTTYQLLDYADWPDEHGQPMRNPIRGSELGPDGRIYLLEGYAWSQGGPDNDCPTVRVYASQDAPPPPEPPLPPDPPPTPDPVELDVAFTADLAALRAGQPFGLSRINGAATVVIDQGNGATLTWGDSNLPAYTQPSPVGGYELAVIDADDPSREVRTRVHVDGPLQFEVSDRREIASPDALRALGLWGSDNTLGICRPEWDQEGTTNDLYFFHLSEIGCVTRTLGTWDDPLYYGQAVRVEVAGNPFQPWPTAGLWSGPVHVVHRPSKPPKLVMAALAANTGQDRCWGSVHWLHSDDWGLSWKYGGVAWQHAVSFAEWLCNPWRSASGYPAYANFANAGSGLLLVENDGGVDHLYLPLAQLNGPVYGPGGSPGNWCPFGWAKVPIAELCERLDAGAETASLTRKWHNGSWSEPFNGKATAVSTLGGLWTNQVSWNYDLGLYLAIGQPASTVDGNTIQLAYSRDLLTWSDPQTVLRYDNGQHWYAGVSAFISPGGTGREMAIWYEVWTEGPGIEDFRIGLEGVTVRFS